MAKRRREENERKAKDERWRFQRKAGENCVDGIFSGPSITTTSSSSSFSPCHEPVRNLLRVLLSSVDDDVFFFFFRKQQQLKTHIFLFRPRRRRYFIVIRVQKRCHRCPRRENRPENFRALFPDPKEFRTPKQRTTKRHQHHQQQNRFPRVPRRRRRVRHVRENLLGVDGA